MKNKRLYNKYKYVTPYLIYELLLYKKEHNILNDNQFYSNYKKIIGTLNSIGIFVNL